ncbi:MAG: alpha/beta hydrolase [Bacteroidetes bacterium]|nr:alpha/beta hydrolase [Bacteroidota bacterium]
MQHLHDQFTLRHKGADMPVWVEGNATSKGFVVVVHGGPGGDAQIYNTYMKEFSDKMESELAMVYWDQRGSGNSAGHFSQEDYTLLTYTEDLDKLIDVLKMRYGGDSRIFILGHSWGGTLITNYAIDAERQKKIAGFIEVDGAHDFKSVNVIINAFKSIGGAEILKGRRTAEWQEIIDYCKTVDPSNPTDEQISKLNAYGFTAESYLSEFGEIAGNSGTVANGAYMWRSSYSVTLAKMNEFYTNNAMFNELKTVDLTGKMNQIKVPGLFIWGKYDMVVPFSSGFSGFNQYGGIDKTFVSFKNSGHSPMLNQMEDFVGVVVPWVKARL